MRLWSLHPRHLDPPGLVALWRETLLARAVLRGKTRGYRRHPQLQRFREHPRPVPTINAYLGVVYEEARVRGYRFDRSRFGPVREVDRLAVGSGQLAFEWSHLLRKLALRNPAQYEHCAALPGPDCHPLFRIVPGPVAGWERGGRAGAGQVTCAP